MILEVRDTRARSSIILSRSTGNDQAAVRARSPGSRRPTIELKALAATGSSDQDRRQLDRPRWAPSRLRRQCAAADIKKIVRRAGGEKIDIVRWNDSSQILIAQRAQAGRGRGSFALLRAWTATVL